MLHDNDGRKTNNGVDANDAIANSKKPSPRVK